MRNLETRTNNLSIEKVVDSLVSFDSMRDTGVLSMKLMGAQSNRFEGYLFFGVEVRKFWYWGIKLEYSDRVAIISTVSKGKHLSIVQNKLEA